MDKTIFTKIINLKLEFGEFEKNGHDFIDTIKMLILDKYFREIISDFSELNTTLLMDMDVIFIGKNETMELSTGIGDMLK